MLGATAKHDRFFLNYDSILVSRSRLADEEKARWFPYRIATGSHERDTALVAMGTKLCATQRSNSLLIFIKIKLKYSSKHSHQNPNRIATDPH